jgi:chemotaxis protein CheX
MPATQEIPEKLIRENISRAVTHVFTTMLENMPAVTFAKDQDAFQFNRSLSRSAKKEMHVISTVGFIGDVTGIIYIYLPLPLAKLCARAMLRLSEHELEEAGDEAINDAVGEFTNITVGTFKSGLCDAGFPCMLTMPSVLRGDQLCLEPGNSAHRQIYAFECSGHRIVTDILIKVAE